MRYQILITILTSYGITSKVLSFDSRPYADIAHKNILVWAGTVTFEVQAVKLYE